VRQETGVAPVAVHANYLINLAAADYLIREKSVASFREEVERGLALGADYLVVHPGSARGACESDAIRTCAESLNAACVGLSLGGFRILLENTAGQGECIGHRFEHLREITRLCPGLNLGVCLDTAHAFTAGYDIRSRDGLAAALDSLAARSPVPTTVAYEAEGDLPEPVELAAYFVASEALTNVAKYAQATAVTVRVAQAGPSAIVEIADDGVGGADEAGGSGLRGLADRVEALDGRMRVWTPRGHGTRVRAEIPCA